jgi:Tol biopolymer transport system component
MRHLGGSLGRLRKGGGGLRYEQAFGDLGGSVKRTCHGMACQLALGAVTIGLAALASALAPAAAAAQVPRIAYGYEGKSVEGVFVIRVDGLDRHRVTQDLHAASVRGFGPDWSPDGTRIALAGYRNGTSKIFTVRPNGTGQKRITRGASCFGDNSPDWSAHSQHVVFVRDYCDPVKLFSVRRDGTQLTRLTQSGVYDPASGSEPRWSPDSRWIAFARQDESYGFQIWVMRRDGSDKAQLTEGPADPDVKVPQQRYPQWSPDSTTLVYTEVQAREFAQWTESEVCTVPISGGSATCLTDAPGADSDAHYSPDGQRIVFVSNRDGNENIYVMDANGSNEHALTTNLASDTQPEWSPDGEWIAFLSERSGHVDLYVVHPDRTGLRRLTRNAGVEDAPTWAPAG